MLFRSIFNMANSMRQEKDKQNDASVILYLLHQAIEKCKIIDQKSEEIKKLKGKMDVNEM